MTNKYYEYAVVIAWPHDWRGDSVLVFKEEFEARQFAESYPKSPRGTDKYNSVRMYTLVEEFN